MHLIPKSPKIYILPNLFTAGNLLFGFIAILFIFEQIPLNANNPLGDLNHFHLAIACILAAGVLDLLDGLVARMRGQESPFGQEFDSLADIVSFGVAPALLLMELVLGDFARIGIIIACLYLGCGAMRLARFNVLATEQKSKTSGEFIGLPIPSAAIVITSLTLLLLELYDHDKDLGVWRFGLPVLMVMVSLLMISGVRYPSFKRFNMRTKRSIPWMILAILIVMVTVMWLWLLPAILSTSYLLYGLVRPWISKRWRHEIEESDDDDDDDDDGILTEVEKPAPSAVAREAGPAND